MKNAHTQLLLLEMKEHYPYFHTPALERYCANYTQWREALARYAGCISDEAKAEITKIFYGSRPNTDLPFLMHLT